MGGREVSRPYRNWFFAEGERFLSFWRCHRPRRLRGLGKGLFDVVLVQDEVDEGGYVAHINFSVAVDVGFSGHWLGAENHID